MRDPELSQITMPYTAALQINSNVIETSGTITDSAQVLDINQTHADATGNVVDIDNDGTGTALKISQDATLAPGKSGFHLLSSAAQTANYLFQVQGTSSSSTVRTALIEGAGSSYTLSVRANGTGGGLEIISAGSNNALFVDNDNNAVSINVDQDGNSASKIWGMKIDVDNAGAGGVGGIDFSGMAAGEALLKVPTDAGAIGAVQGRIAVDVAGTVRYVPYYA